MKFTTPCFVRVEDAEKRDALIEWCASIGYNTNTLRLPQSVCYVFADGDFAGRSGEKAIVILSYDLIDCGTDIELFKALAAMTDDRDDVNQWYVFAADYYFGEEDVYYHRGHVISGIDMIYVFEDWRNALYYCRKATAYEIVEHFKK